VIIVLNQMSIETSPESYDWLISNSSSSFSFWTRRSVSLSRIPFFSGFRVFWNSLTTFWASSLSDSSLSTYSLNLAEIPFFGFYSISYVVWSSADVSNWVLSSVFFSVSFLTNFYVYLPMNPEGSSYSTTSFFSGTGGYSSLCFWTWSWTSSITCETLSESCVVFEVEFAPLTSGFMTVVFWVELVF